MFNPTQSLIAGSTENANNSKGSMLKAVIFAIAGILIFAGALQHHKVTRDSETSEALVSEPGSEIAVGAYPDEGSNCEDYCTSKGATCKPFKKTKVCVTNYYDRSAKVYKPIDNCQSLCGTACIFPELPRWKTGKWGECNKSCGGGTKQRTVECSQQPETKCTDPKPAAQQECNVAECGQWTHAPFTDCDVTCGGGTRVAVVTCEPDGAICDDNQNPGHKFEECATEECPWWTTDPAEVQMCQQLAQFNNYDITGLSEEPPLFGVEAEIQANGFGLKSGNDFFVMEDDSPCTWGYTKIVGTVYYQGESLVLFEGEMMCIVEVVGTAKNAWDNDEYELYKCQRALWTEAKLIQIAEGAKQKDQRKNYQTWFEQDLLKNPTKRGGACFNFKNDLEARWTYSDHGGINQAGAKAQTVKQLNIGVPLQVWDVMLLGEISEENYKVIDGTNVRKGYSNELPVGLQAAPSGQKLFPLRHLRKWKNAADALKLQLIPDENIRSLCSLWREIWLALKYGETKDKDSEKPYWKKKHFNLFPKHKFTGQEDIYKKAVLAYNKLFTSYAPYVQGYRYNGAASGDGYGHILRKDPRMGIRINYADSADTKSYKMVRDDPKGLGKELLYIVAETRSEGEITTNYGNDGKLRPQIKEIQSWKNNPAKTLKSRCPPPGQQNGGGGGGNQGMVQQVDF